MKRLLGILTGMLLCLLTVSACAETRIMAVSDLHLMAPCYYEGSDLLERAMLSGDGKVPQYSRELADALVAEAIHQQPDVLVVTGDLSMNGEYRSHLFVQETLERIRAAGIPVCVIPGNHDIGTFMAYDYSGTELKAVNSVSETLFAKIYADLMPGASAPEGCSLSYVYKVTDSVWLLLLNTCYYEDGQAAGGYLREGLTDWAEQVLREAQAAGVQVICATHQSLSAHSAFRSSQFSVYDGERLETLLASYGMKLNLSGHVHAQHLLQVNDIWDAATGGWCISPHLYAMVTVSDEGSITYEAQPVCEEHLPEGLADTTKDFFRMTTIRKLDYPEDADEALQEQIAELKFELNYAYFSGTLYSTAQALEDNSTWQWLLAHDSGSFFTEHLRQMIGECPTDMRTLVIP